MNSTNDHHLYHIWGYLHLPSNSNLKPEGTSDSFPYVLTVLPWKAFSQLFHFFSLLLSWVGPYSSLTWTISSLLTILQTYSFQAPTCCQSVHSNIPLYLRSFKSSPSQQDQFQTFNRNCPFTVWLPLPLPFSCQSPVCWPCLLLAARLLYIFYTLLYLESSPLPMIIPHLPLPRKCFAQTQKISNHLLRFTSGIILP